MMHVDKTFFRSFKRIAWLIVLGMGLLFLDFAAKAYVYHVLTINSCNSVHCQAISVFYDIAGVDFLISLAVNKGAAWGVFADFQILLLIVRILVIFGMFFYLFFINHNSSYDVPLVLILTGAVGNVIDFFLYGFVVDFLHFNLWGYHFPIFNFADTCITIGVVWLFVIGLFNRKRKYA